MSGVTSYRSLVLLCVTCFLLQIGYWQLTISRLPDMTVVPTPPGEETLQALSAGDPETLFRLLAFMMSNSGDTYGRFTPLYKYDMKLVGQWFSLLDTLDARSNLLPTLASIYYSQTQKVSDVAYLARYLHQHGARDPANKWWWLVQGVYLAQHRLKDFDLAAEIAEDLKNNPDIPLVAQQLAAIVHEQRGEMDQAMAIMESILENVEMIPDKQLKYMKYFIDERLHRLDELEGRAKDRLHIEENP